MEKLFTKSAYGVFQEKRISRFCFVNIPQRLTNYRNSKELPLKLKRPLVKAAEKFTRRSMYVIIPQDGNGIYEEFFKESCTSKTIVDGMIKVLEMIKKVSV